MSSSSDGFKDECDSKGAKDEATDAVQPLKEANADASHGALDPQKLRELIERHYPQLLRVARAHSGRSLKGKEEPEDLAQTACRRVVQDLESGALHWQGEKAFLNYVLTVMRHKVVDKARYHNAERRDVGREQALDDPSSVERAQESPSGVYRVKERKSHLDAAISKLPEESAEVVRRYFIEQRTFEQIAEELGKSVGAVRHTLKKGLEALQHRVSREIC